MPNAQTDNQASDTVERTIRIAARPETVFQHFTDPARVARWLGPATFDARPGGDEADGHGEGWLHYLKRLATLAAGGDPGPDEHAPAAAEPANAAVSA